MDTLTIIVVTGVVSVFVIFAGVLAYVERATRNLHRLPTPVLQVEKPAAAEDRRAA